MSTVFNRAESFRDDMVEGLLAAYGRYLEAVPGATAVMRRGGPSAGKVSLVIGGGSGHYPAFAGLVGHGLADCAVVGDVFASPGADQIYRSTLAVDGGSGVLLACGRYSGDVMNFGLAKERALADGADVRLVVVTDDVAAAPPERRDQRRGIAGNFCVFKVAGAAAERGAGLDEVERVARKANERTRTLGVAFAGCTLPGSSVPLFTIDPDRIEVGMGIHGEPGVRSGQRAPAAQLAELLVEALLDGAERPEGAGERAVILLNGLGRTKYEELFVLYREVSRLLATAGVFAVAPEVDELVTSLDMAGCSLTMFWVDDELEALWQDPADSPAYRKPGVAVVGPFARAEQTTASKMRTEAEATTRLSAADVPGAPADVVGATLVRSALAAMLRAIEPAEEELGRLDAVAGDGDHGRAMVRGLRAATISADAAADVPGQVLEMAGRAWADAAGGASGALWGAMLQTAGRVLYENGAGPDVVARVLHDAVATLGTLGDAKLGDKTMLDTLGPFAQAYSDAARAGHSVAGSWSEALVAAEEGAWRTADIPSTRGRSAVLGDRSVGTPDPGAVSMLYCLRAVRELFANI